MLSLTKRALLDAKAPNDNLLGTELHKTKNVLKAVYDFAVQGGAIGTVSLLDDAGNPAILPTNAIIVRSHIHVLTALAGATATIAVNSEGAGDIRAATAVATYALNALLDGVSDGTSANMKRMTADRQVAVTIATAALTAGKMNIFVEYVISG